MGRKIKMANLERLGRINKYYLRAPFIPPPPSKTTLSFDVRFLQRPNLGLEIFPGSQAITFFDFAPARPSISHHMTYSRTFAHFFLIIARFFFDYYPPRTRADDNCLSS